MSPENTQGSGGIDSVMSDFFWGIGHYALYSAYSVSICRIANPSESDLS